MIVPATTMALLAWLPGVTGIRMRTGAGAVEKALWICSAGIPAVRSRACTARSRATSCARPATAGPVFCPRTTTPVPPSITRSRAWVSSAERAAAADPMARTRAVPPRAAASPMTDDASPPEYEVDVAGREAAGGDVADGEREDRSVLVREVGAEWWPVMPGGYGRHYPGAVVEVEVAQRVIVTLEDDLG